MSGARLPPRQTVPGRRAAAAPAPAAARRCGRAGPRRRPAGSTRGSASGSSRTPSARGRACGQQADARARRRSGPRPARGCRRGAPTRGTKPASEATRADRVLVGGVAGVHDPVAVAVAVEDRRASRPARRRRRPARRGPSRPPTAAPPRASRSKPRRRQVVVVGQRQVDVVGGEQRRGLGRLVLVDPQVHVGVLGGQACARPAAATAVRRWRTPRPGPCRPARPTGRGRAGPPRSRRGSSRRGRPAAGRPG